MSEAFRRRYEALIDGAMRAAATLMAGEYHALIESSVKSKTLKEDYKRLVRDESTEQVIRIGLPPRGDGAAKLAWRTEAGGPAYRLHDTVLKGGKTHVNVPFDKSEEKVSKVIEDMKRSKSSMFFNTAESVGYRMEKARAAVVKAKATPSIHSPSDGGRIMQFGSRLPAGLVDKMREGHAADPLARMTALAAPYSQKPGEQVVRQFTGYRIWRRLSANSDPAKWRIPATPGVHVAERLETDPGVRDRRARLHQHMADKLNELIKEFL